MCIFHSLLIWNLFSYVSANILGTRVDGKWSCLTVRRSQVQAPDKDLSVWSCSCSLRAAVGFVPGVSGSQLQLTIGVNVRVNRCLPRCVVLWWIGGQSKLHWLQLLRRMKWWRTAGRLFGWMDRRHPGVKSKPPEHEQTFLGFCCCLLEPPPTLHLSALFCFNHF